MEFTENMLSGRGCESVRHDSESDQRKFANHPGKLANELKSSRPTHVNLNQGHVPYDKVSRFA